MTNDNKSLSQSFIPCKHLSIPHYIVLILLRTSISTILSVFRSKMALPRLKFGARPLKMVLFFNRAFTFSVCPLGNSPFAKAQPGLYKNRSTFVAIRHISDQTGFDALLPLYRWCGQHIAVGGLAVI